MVGQLGEVTSKGTHSFRISDYAINIFWKSPHSFVQLTSCTSVAAILISFTLFSSINLKAVLRLSISCSLPFGALYQTIIL